MGKYGRYYSNRDMNMIQALNAELLVRIVQSIVTVYKFSAGEIKTNIYGESDQSTGKFYYPGVDTECLVEFSDSTTKYDEFGSDKKNSTKFRFNESFLRKLDLYPENGDIIFWDSQYQEVKNVIQEQFVGGQPDNQFSIICETDNIRLSTINILERARE